MPQVQSGADDDAVFTVTPARKLGCRGTDIIIFGSSLRCCEPTSKEIVVVVLASRGDQPCRSGCWLSLTTLGKAPVLRARCRQRRKIDGKEQFESARGFAGCVSSLNPAPGRSDIVKLPFTGFQKLA